MREPFFQGIACDQGGSLEGLHRPNRFRMSYLTLKRGVDINVIAGVDPGYINAGLMKPRKEFTLVAARKNWGWARILLLLDSICIFSYTILKRMERGRIE